jgi:hypothetical protein
MLLMILHLTFSSFENLSNLLAQHVDIRVAGKSGACLHAMVLDFKIIFIDLFLMSA